MTNVTPPVTVPRRTLFLMSDTTREPQPIALDHDAMEGMISSIVAQAAEQLCQAHASQGGLSMSRAWIYQRPEQVRALGEEETPYRVGWIDPEGVRRAKSFGPGKQGSRLAEQFRRKVEAELLTGTYNSNASKTWQEFRQEYHDKALAGLAPLTVKAINTALDAFERVIGPKKMAGVRTATIDQFKTQRLTERGVQPGTTLSAATVNRDLRHLRAAFKKARKWGYFLEAPDFDFLREAKKWPCYVTPEHFVRLYAVCEQARLPRGLPYPSADWWRALLTLIQMTGWRIEQALLLRRQDMDLATGAVYSNAEDNKAGRDVKLVLHPLVTEHLRRVLGFGDVFLPWPGRGATLWKEFRRLQDMAGVKPDRKEHYGFHDLRRAFATLNADRLTADALQALMQHKDYQTTQKYINMARQLQPAAQNLYVPELPPRSATTG